MRELLPAVLSAVALFICLPTLSLFAQQQPSVSNVANSALLWVTVTDEQGNYQTQFSQQDFRLEANSALQPITFFSKEHNHPVSAVFLVDRSSFYDVHTPRPATPLSAVPVAVSAFLAKFPPKSEFSIIGFQEKPEMLLDWSEGKDEVATQLKAVSTVKSKRSSRLYDACKAGIEQAQKGKHQKRIVILFSRGLGEVENSHIRPRELKSILKNSDVLIYVINLGSSEYVTFSAGGGAFHSEEYVEPSFLKDLGKISGGRLFHPQSRAGIQWTLENLATELHCQYGLGFQLPSPPSDQYYKLRISLQPSTVTSSKNQKLSVKHREGIAAAPKRK